jgi:hypothetical protein
VRDTYFCWLKTAQPGPAGILDALQAGFVHIERIELDLVADTGLCDCAGSAVGVTGANRDNTVNGVIFQQGGLDGPRNRGGVAKAGRRQRQLA